MSVQSRQYMSQRSKRCIKALSALLIGLFGLCLLQLYSDGDLSKGFIDLAYMVDAIK